MRDGAIRCRDISKINRIKKLLRRLCASALQEQAIRGIRRPGPPRRHCSRPLSISMDGKTPSANLHPRWSSMYPAEMASDTVAASCISAAASALRSTKLLHRQADPSSSRDAEALPFAPDSRETDSLKNRSRRLSSIPCQTGIRKA